MPIVDQFMLQLAFNNFNDISAILMLICLAVNWS